ncbi:MAG: glycosyltransferase family 2 protein [Candidatus Omnitrophica bacterium]|nr:glycosyltransferase family 2 protein [Candidatus Omnitrophota bacterium]
MNTCVIIPTYNESRAIAGLVDSIRRAGLEAIVVDDGSTDDTVQAATRAGAEVLRNFSNAGKGASLVKGYSFAVSRGFDALISMDGDGQHSVDDIKSFISKAESSNCGIVAGNRMEKTGGMPLLRVFTNHFMSWMISFVTGQRIPDTQCGFRLIRKEVMQKIKLSTSKYETESEILIEAARAGFKIESVSIKTIYSGQKSQINPFFDTLRFMRFMLAQFMKGFRHA